MHQTITERLIDFFHCPGDVLTLVEMVELWKREKGTYLSLAKEIGVAAAPFSVWLRVRSPRRILEKRKAELELAQEALINAQLLYAKFMEGISQKEKLDG